MEKNKTVNAILMPLPLFIENKEGYFKITRKSGIKCASKFNIVKNLILEQFEFNSKNESIEFTEKEGLEKEEYIINVSNEKISIDASTSIGFYHGMQTIRQLMISCNNIIPCCIIKDKPKYYWRGFMVDCSRHFISIKELKKLIDLAALHHLNIFHWHLTDDQGWRLEIPSLPKLTEIGASRQNIHYEIPMVEKNYYSEAEVKDLISYAKNRFITIVPEIEFPGHVRAFLAAYPQYGCKDKKYEVLPHWGIFDEVICVGNDKVLDIITQIFSFVAELFPSPYIHIGGDECPTTYWKNCPKCNKKMKELNLTNENQLQGYFTSAICNIVDKLNKIPIGWDEVLDGTDIFDLPKSLIIMSWRGIEGGKKAASLHHKVIMCPNEDGCYFNFQHLDDFDEPGNLGVCTIEKVSKFSPTAQEIDVEHRQYVIGGQGNIWTEKIASGKEMEYMLYPRLSIMAERLWNPQSLESIEKRKTILIERLRKLDINCYSGPSK